jgi:hypothetical protein
VVVPRPTAAVLPASDATAEERIAMPPTATKADRRQGRQIAAETKRVTKLGFSIT